METQKRVYIDLDSLFDTRLGCLAEINPKLTLQALEDGFLKRNCDSFSFIKKDKFDSLYKLRDIETLRLSPFTACHKLLASVCVSMLKGSVDGPDITGVKVVVNINPYKLSEVEAGDLLSLIVEKTGRLVEVQLVDIPFKDLTLSHCESNYDVMFMYDYMYFLEQNVVAKNHIKHSLYDRILIAPEIFLREITKKDIDKIYRNNPALSNYTPAAAVKAMASPVVCLEFVGPEIFSVDQELYKSDFYKLKEEHNS